MGLQFAAACGIGAVSTWGLKHVFHRPAANFPGKVALYVDPDVIAHLATRLREGSVVVVGTNGKTTTTNLLADVIEASGKTGWSATAPGRTWIPAWPRRCCSRRVPTGAYSRPTSCGWQGSFPVCRPPTCLLLNLFRDQLDRCGEIDRIQESIIGALRSSPNTTLVYNADDPLCAYIADQVDNASVTFGVSEDMGLPQNSVADAQMCQRCSSMFEYAFRQYGQLGAYRCPQCGFGRPALDYAVSEASVAASGVSFTLQVTLTAQGEKARDLPVRASLGGAYMVYNLAAVTTASDLLGCPQTALQRAIDAFDPQNGRLQTYHLHGRRVLLNLAKNPTGFNQNLKIIDARHRSQKRWRSSSTTRRATGATYRGCGTSTSRSLPKSGRSVVFAGGPRRNDLQVRLKYAGPARRSWSIRRLPCLRTFRRRRCPLEGRCLPMRTCYLIANYTALPPVHDELDCMVQEGRNAQHVDGLACRPAPHDAEAPARKQAVAADGADAAVPTAAPDDTAAASDGAANAQPASPLVIAHLFPDLLNLYGDGGNVRMSGASAAEWRGIPVEVRRREPWRDDRPGRRSTWCFWEAARTANSGWRQKTSCA